MRALLAAAAIALLWRSASAAPAADLVVYWAPPDTSPAWRDEVRTAAARAGAAFVDRSPAAAAPPAAPGLVAEGVAAYAALRFDDAVAALDRAATEIDTTGAAGLTPVALADLFLFRGLARIQRGDPAAWYDVVTAARVDPARTLDPAQFPPRAIEQLERAKRTVAGEARVTITVTPAAADCTVLVDAAHATGGRAEVAPGTHWVHVICPGRAGSGRRVVALAPGLAIDVAPPALASPDGDEALIQARAAGAGAVIDVVVAGGIARARRRRADGRELDRTSVTLAGARPGTLDAVVTEMLAPGETPVPPRHWYRSRWVWAAGGALAAAAVLVPIVLSSSDGEPDVVVRPTGWPPW